MQRAIKLARKAQGTTSPNPAVGTVIVKDDTVIAEGHTLPWGRNHAEIEALQLSDERSHGATLYTTLEPCCHFGRTPPCTKAIISAGISKVHLAAIDPNPEVSGRGRAELEAAGLEVEVGEEADAAQELYEAFAKHITTGLSFVTAKFAMSLDGKIATNSGDSKWVTGPEAREMVQDMRRESDAVMVGVNTILADDPQLTARDLQDKPLQHQPLRVVLDSYCRTPIEAKLLREPGTTIIATTQDAPALLVARMETAGAEVYVGPAGQDGRVDLQSLLAELGHRGVVSLLAEGGGGILGSLFDAGLVDKVFAFIAPSIIGGGDAPSPVAGQGTSLMSEAWRVERAQMRQIGPDWLITGYPAARS